MLKTPIVIKNLSKQYSGEYVVKNISFDIGSSEICGLLGLNGAGKTTIIKSIINTVFTSKSTDIKIFGIDSKKNISREKLFYLPEKFTPTQNLTGLNFLDISSSYFNIKKDDTYYNIIKDYCEIMNLNFNVLKKTISSYSKGMCQKVGLISAFISNSNILILDEPMSGLDPLARIAFKESIKYFKSINKYSSILLSSHMFTDVEKICDTISVIHLGQMLYYGDIKTFNKQQSCNNLEDSFIKLITE